MQTLQEQKPARFVDRRQNREGQRSDGPERRQFSDSHQNENTDVTELAQAVDQYKVRHRRRFITYEELLSVISGLGYSK